MTEHILVIIKPDGMLKGHAGHVLARFEETDLLLVGGRVVKVTRELAETHYAHLKDKPFFAELIRFLMGELHNNQDMVLALIFSGEDAVKKGRAIAGATNPELAEPHSIRGSLGRVTTKGVFENVIHVSSDALEGEREIKLWFSPDEVAREIFPSKLVAGRKAWL
ncbi:MAG: nucleoside-diphosphate kinase [Candidatus Omnitrophica bacterium]|nr:nucleoside-diphosphate kinase [Candidatus Omnitrophota bacterium]